MLAELSAALKAILDTAACVPVAGAGGISLMLLGNAVLSVACAAAAMDAQRSATARITGCRGLIPLIENIRRM
jgi:hypothetical protein